MHLIVIRRQTSCCHFKLLGMLCLKKMASEVDMSSSDSELLAKPPIFPCSSIKNLEKEESAEAPLQTPWTLWLDKTVRGCTASEYESNLKKIYTFSTIQGFWAVYNNVPDVGSIQTGYSYHLMREERRPIWEEPYNQGGGTWRFRCNKNETSKVWKELLLAAIGEQFLDSVDPNDEICGLTVSVRDKFDVVRLWNISAQLEKKASVINKVFKLLPDVEFAEPFYKLTFYNVMGPINIMGPPMYGRSKGFADRSGLPTHFNSGSALPGQVTYDHPRITEKNRSGSENHSAF